MNKVRDGGWDSQRAVPKSPFNIGFEFWAWHRTKGECIRWAKMDFRFRHPHSGISNIENLANALDTEAEILVKHSAEYDNKYRPKTIPKSDGSPRLLNVPNDELKWLQRQINGRILAKVQFPDYVFGGIRAEQRGTDYIDAAKFHAGAKVLAKLDISDFFPSVTSDHVRTIFRDFFNFNEHVCDTFVGICTHFNELPQGSPTSVALAQMALFQDEPSHARYLHEQGFKYSRFIDDIFITGAKKDALIQAAFRKTKRMLEKHNFTINAKKSEEKIPASEGLRIFGVLVSEKKAKLTGKDVAKIRSKVQKLEKRAKIANARKSSRYRKSWDRISGSLNKLKRVDHPKYPHYRTRMRKILPLAPDSEIGRLKKEVQRLEQITSSGINSRPAFKRYFYRIRARIGILGRNNVHHAEPLRQRMRKIQKQAGV